MQTVTFSKGLGKKLKLARIEVGLTQSEVGKKMYCCNKVIQRIESGDREPKISELNRLAEIYRKPIAFFMSVER